MTSLFSLDTLIVAAFLTSKLLLNKGKNCLHCIPCATKRESTIRSCGGDQFYWCQVRMKKDLPSKIKMQNSKDKKPTVKQYFLLKSDFKQTFQNIRRKYANKFIWYLNCGVQTLSAHYPMNISMKSRLGIHLL